MDWPFANLEIGATITSGGSAGPANHHSDGRIDVQDAMIGVWPFVVMDLAIVALLIALPQIATGLVPDRL